MQCYCPKTGITFTVSGAYGSCVISHPIFAVSLRKLITDHGPAFIAGKLNDEEIHTLGCSLVSKLPIQRWEVPLDINEWLPAWKLHIPDLFRVASIIVSNKIELFPKISITKNTNTPDNLPGWIDAIDTTLKDIQDNYISVTQLQKLANREAAITRLLKSAMPKSRNQVSKLIATWAADVAQFPTCSAGPDRKDQTLKDYWIQIINLAFNNSHADLLAANVTAEDIKELIEHCEEYIPHGSTHAAELMFALRKAHSLLGEFLLAPVAKITDDDSRQNSEQENIPEPPKPGNKPVRTDYNSIKEFLQAQLAWNTQAAAWHRWKRNNIEATDL